MTASTRFEIRMSGFGGQGIIMMGKVLGSAVSLYHGHHATLVQSYGPETRGSSCRVDLILDSKPIDYPCLTQPHLLVVLSQAAYQQYRPGLAPGGLLIYESDLVTLNEIDRNGNGGSASVVRRAVPAVGLADECGGRIMANVVVLGYLAAHTSWVSIEAIKQTITDRMPAAMAEKNLIAAQRGYEFGLEGLDHEEEINVNAVAHAISPN